ncbi:hypothetical protein BDF21DRAFT_398375 [Thamnidium elegans]|nr:hypothetical protein BDF21DRAFT_398375 [Thamnidium elegans]
MQCVHCTSLSASATLVLRSSSPVHGFSAILIVHSAKSVFSEKLNAHYRFVYSIERKQAVSVFDANSDLLATDNSTVLPLFMNSLSQNALENFINTGSSFEAPLPPPPLPT